MPNGKHGEIVVPLILPHVLVEHLVGECQLPLNDQRICQYWAHLESVRDPIALATKSFREHSGLPVIPLCIYGDEAQINLQCNPGCKVFGMNLSFPLWRPTATRLSRFILFNLDSDQISSFTETVWPILERIVESLNTLTSSGVAGRRFILTEIRGDQAFMKILLQHKSYWTSKKICFRCKACTDIPELDYTKYSANEPNGWPSTIYTTEQFIVNELPSDQQCS